MDIHSHISGACMLASGTFTPSPPFHPSARWPCSCHTIACTRCSCSPTSQPKPGFLYLLLLSSSSFSSPPPLPPPPSPSPPPPLTYHPIASTPLLYLHPLSPLPPPPSTFLPIASTPPPPPPLPPILPSSSPLKRSIMHKQQCYLLRRVSQDNQRKHNQVIKMSLRL